MALNGTSPPSLQNFSAAFGPALGEERAYPKAKPGGEIWPPGFVAKAQPEQRDKVSQGCDLAHDSPP